MRAVLICLALLVACGPPEPDRPRSDASGAAAPDCADLEPLGSDLAVGDDPAPDPAAVREWAQAEAPDSYAGIWLDREAGGVTVAFTDDVDRRRGEVRDRFGDGLRVVEAQQSHAELLELVDEVSREMGTPDGDVTSAGVRETVNRVSIGVLDADEARQAELAERYGADRICLEVEPIPGEEHAQVAQWEPAPDADLSPDAREIPVLVNERACASGAPADGRITDPEVDYGAETVTVTIRVVPRPGPQTCPSNPETPYTLTLDEPLGDRELVDGGREPPGTPAIER